MTFFLISAFFSLLVLSKSAPPVCSSQQARVKPVVKSRTPELAVIE